MEALSKEHAREASDSQLRLSRFSYSINQLYRNYLSKKLPELDLSLSNYSIILYLFHHLDSYSDGVSQTHLCKNLLKDKAAIARGVQTLERLKYVNVKPDDSNSSRNLVSLTEKGIAAGSQVDDWVYCWEDRALNNLGEDGRRQFLLTFQELFRKINDADINNSC